MKRALVLVILISLVALPALGSGCTSVMAHTRDTHTYSSEICSPHKASPASEQEVLNFLAQDSTDKNVWMKGVYECGHAAADLWWNAYMQGLEACMVWAKYWKHGTERVHWLVKFDIEDGSQSYWLWVEPSNDGIVDEGDYTLQDTYCGEQALNLCKTWWTGNSS